jgi:hypothetical protein
MMKRFMLSAVVCTAMMFAQVGHAQEVVFDDIDAANIFLACSSGDAEVCLAAVNLVIEKLQAAGLSAASLNIQIASLASVLADVARDNPVASVFLATSEALQFLAKSSSDPAQQAAILTLATAVSNGEVPDKTTVLTSTTPISGA